MYRNSFFSIVLDFFSSSCSFLIRNSIYIINASEKLRVQLPKRLYLTHPLMKPLAYILLISAVLTGYSFREHAAPAPSAPNEILVLATHYLSYAEPGSPTCDILAPEKQAEMQALLAHLAQFQPTRITLDVPVRSQWDTLINARYQAFLAGDRSLSRSVEEQIGFRLGEMTGQQHLYATGNQTETGNLFQTVAQSDRDQLLGAVSSLLQERSRLMSQRLVRGSLVDFFQYLNDPVSLAREQGIFRNHFERIADTDYRAGASLLAAWYDLHRERLAHLQELIPSAAGERVVMVVPAAYAPLLRELVRKSSDWRLVEPTNLLQIN